MKPLLFITAGDPLGIGPEITVKALRHAQVRRACRAVVIGEPASLYKAGFTNDLAALIPLDTYEPLPSKPQPSKTGGLVSFQAVKTACQLSLKTGAPLVTAPISKQSWTMAHIPFTGHTELLRAYTHHNGLMMFVSGKLCCGLVSEHFALSHLPLTQKKVENAALHLQTALKKLCGRTPLIGVCAVNPHGSDNGKFGTEEKKILLPALKSLQTHGHFTGPLPSDVAWLQHRSGQLGGLLCMYHDQALLGMKLAAAEPIVHLTAGLPFVRTSPTHGTAFDIAGKNKADASGMVAAILFAAAH